MDLKEIHIWNIKYNLLTVDEIVMIVNKWLSEGRKGVHLTGADAYVTVLAQKDELLHRAIMESDIVNVDSYYPTKMLAKQGYEIRERVTTPDVMEGFLKSANEKGQKIYLLGAKEETLQALIEILKRDYPNMKIVGFHNGYFKEEEEDAIAEAISKVAPDYLFLGMPTPRKEHFILKYKRKIDVGVFLGVGGAFDARANVMKRPPKFMRGHGLEAFFRVLRSPRVYGKRLHIFREFDKLVEEYNNKLKDN
ncbi:MAG: WecB/TagA/CpsF family glycosyltransferase [Paludibacteraceae bacterium]|nr:WecB/TagA/CpsF family glycosyltransferase [Paludibacteraceae bacterium]MBP5664523.1 WecB/TagA/CpsF family glycosyltransferase [Bacteroidales bacterium]